MDRPPWEVADIFRSYGDIIGFLISGLSFDLLGPRLFFVSSIVAGLRASRRSAGGA